MYNQLNDQFYLTVLTSRLSNIKEIAQVVDGNDDAVLQTLVNQIANLDSLPWILTKDEAIDWTNNYANRSSDKSQYEYIADVLAKCGIKQSTNGQYVQIVDGAEQQLSKQVVLKAIAKVQQLFEAYARYYDELR